MSSDRDTVPRVFDAPTVSAPGVSPGDTIPPTIGVPSSVFPRLPAAETTTMPAFTARSHAETEYRLTAVDGGTRFDYRNEFTAPLGPLGRVASRALVGGLPRREADASLRRLKALAERS